MKRSLYAFAAAAMLAATITTAAQAADIRVRIGDRGGNYISFSNEPRVVVIPDTRVYYVRNYDYDLYRYGGYWYYVDDGYWYRASSWRGPFFQVRVSSVPRTVYSVPVRYRRHWRNASYDNVNYYRSRDRYRDRHYRDKNDRDGRDRDGDGRDRDRGRGHGRGGNGNGRF